MLIPTAESIGLGVLGVGLRDIVLFIGMVLKGIYEVAFNYGYDYDSPTGKYFILKLMSASLSKNNDWGVKDSLLNTTHQVDEDMLKSQIEDTSKLFAVDMLVLKFIQRLSVIGAVGGAFNTVCYNKIMNYART